MNRRIVKALFFTTIFIAVILTNCTKAVEVDNEPPNVIIINPEHGAIISEPVIIDVVVTDNEGIGKVDFYIDSLLIKSDEESEYNAYLNPYYYSDGNLHLLHSEPGSQQPGEYLLYQLYRGIMQRNWLIDYYLHTPLFLHSNTLCSKHSGWFLQAF